MRLYPPAPLIVREARRVLRLGTETIGPGTFVYVPVYAVHRHEEFWDRPDLFDPDRFAPEAVKARDRYVYLPFGAGPRICIGMSFALMEATAVLAVLLSSLRLRLRPGCIPHPKLRITLRPPVACRCGLPNRSENEQRYVVTIKENDSGRRAAWNAHERTRRRTIVNTGRNRLYRFPFPP
jgi:cytochrome P450